MKVGRRARSGAVAALACVLVAACAGANDAAPVEEADLEDGKERHRVACVGDSITAGDGTSLWSTAYPARLQALLGERYAVENDGHLGATMSKHGAIPYWTTPELGASTTWVEGGGDVVVLLGTNDANATNWSGREALVADCMALVEHYREVSSSTRVWIGLPPPIATTACCSMASNLEAGVLPALRTCSLAEHATAIDVHGALAEHGAWSTDGVHPDAAGIAVIARSVHAALVKSPAVELEATASATAGATQITLTATPTPAYGVTERVRFYEDGRVLGESVTPPWSLVLAAPAAGMHEYWAEIVETGGRSARSAPIPVELRARPILHGSRPAPE